MLIWFLCTACLALISYVFFSRIRTQAAHRSLIALLKEAKLHESALLARENTALLDRESTQIKLSALRELSVGVAHELNTNLAHMLDAISVYKGKHSQDSAMNQLLEAITKNCLHGRGVIQSLHYTSKETPTSPKKAGNSSGLSILLVDDDELIRLSFTPMLEILGHEVTVASGGLEAIQLVERGLTIDVVILDMNMPGFDGSQTLTRLLMINPDQQVLIASGLSSEGVISKLIAGLPNVGRLHKPFSLGEIREKLDTRIKK